jgi:hypothetical protein
MKPILIGGPWDGASIVEDMEGIDEIQISVLSEEREEIFVYVYNYDTETGNYNYDGEFLPEELEEEEDE